MSKRHPEELLKRVYELIEEMGYSYRDAASTLNLERGAGLSREAVAGIMHRRRKAQEVFDEKDQKIVRRAE